MTLKEASFIKYGINCFLATKVLWFNQFYDIIQKHDCNFDSSKIDMKGSSNGKYISLTCKVYVTGQKQLDKIYIDLSKNPMTKFVL